MEQMTQRLNLKARAKVNLGLDVKRRLANGYHEVKMVMQTVDIFDELEFERRGDSDIVLTLESRDDLGSTDDNLICRAARLMKEHYGISAGISIHLKKNIPVAAGMAGGSTDAAATMLAMNALFGLNQEKSALMELSAGLGADIPFCILGGTALSEGIGEKLTPLPAPPEAYLVVAKPDIMVSTKWVYESLELGGIEKHPDIDGMVSALKKGDLNGVTDRMENVMETVTARQYPIICDIKRMLLEKNALNAIMSGSGPSVFGVYRTKAEADSAYMYINEALGKNDIKAQLFVTTFS